MNWFKKIFHVHEWKYYWYISIFASKYNDGSYYYKCQICGQSVTSTYPPEVFVASQGREIKRVVNY